jgi:hypothetical protein
MRGSKRMTVVLAVLAGCVGNTPESMAPPPPPPGPTPATTPGPASPYAPPPPGQGEGGNFAEPPPPGPVVQPAPVAGSSTIAEALGGVPAAVSTNYVFALSADRSELTIDPRPRPTRAMRDRRSGGFEAKDSANGGKILTLVGGPFRGGRWVRASFREQVKVEGSLAELRRAGYDVELVRDLLVVDGEVDVSPTVFAFSADASKPGIVGICSEVTIVDFKPGAFRPIAVRKPVIYLYPRETTEVRVDVEIAGEFVAVYPAMQAGGWSVTAEPDGTLVDAATGRAHRYLFWEGTSAGFKIDPARAFSVPGADSAGFLERACDRFALTAAECGDFVTYWLPALTRSPHNVIEFLDEQTYEEYARMRVAPAPDAVIRMFMIFRGSATPVSVGAPELAQRERGEFTVVEWGGADVGRVVERVEIR